MVPFAKTSKKVNLRVDIHFLAQGLEEAGSLFVGKEVQQPKQIPKERYLLSLHNPLFLSPFPLFTLLLHVTLCLFF